MERVLHTPAMASTPRMLSRPGAVAPAAATGQGRAQDHAPQGQADSQHQPGLHGKPEQEGKAGPQGKRELQGHHRQQGQQTTQGQQKPQEQQKPQGQPGTQEEQKPQGGHNVRQEQGKAVGQAAEVAKRGAAMTEIVEPVLPPMQPSSAAEAGVPASAAVSAAPGPGLESTARAHEEQQRQEARLRDAHKKAEQAGYEAGLKQAQDESKRLLGEALAKLESLLAAIERQRERVFESAQDELAEVVFSALSMALGAAATGREQVAANAAQLLAGVRERGAVRLRLHPQDVAWLSSVKDDLTAASGHAVTLIPDPAIELGGCIADCGEGTLDARLEVQLQAVRESVLAARASLAGAAEAQ